MQQIHQQLAKRRADSERQVAARTSEVVARCPEIGEWMNARVQLLRDSLSTLGRDMDAMANLPEKMEMANSRIAALLKENGFPADYLSPAYACPLCQDSGVVGSPVQRACSCVQNAYARLAAQSMGIPSRSEETFEGFSESMVPETVLEKAGLSQRQLTVYNKNVCARYAEQFPSPPTKNLLLMGPSGLGKTFLMHAITRRVLDRGYNALMITAYQFLDIARRAYFSFGYTDGASEEMDVVLHADLLLVDDLGSEPLMENITISQLFNLLNERERSGKSTVLSTNLTMNNVKSRYTERISSRLQDAREWTILRFDGDDIRKHAGRNG